MPRTGGVYSPPAGTKGTPNTTIQSVPYNTWVDDLTADANAARPITAGGTGATSASAARTGLGVAIGSDVQAYDAGLQSIAGLTTAADRMIYTTASDVYATTALTPFARTVLDDADASTVLSTLGVSTFMKTVLDDVDAATARATLGVTIGTNVQAFDAGLQSIAGLTTAANQMIYTTALDAYATTALTAFARTILDDADASTVLSTLGVSTFIKTLLDDADAATARTTLGLGSLATASTINNANWSGTDLAVANGGTGASDAATARANLGLAAVAASGSASDLTTGTLPDARLTGAYTGITNLTMTGQLTISNSAPILRFQDTTASAYDARIRLDANNVYFDGSSDGVTYGEVLRFEMDTKIGYMSQLFLTSTGEGIRLQAPTAGNDPFLSFYVAGVRDAFIQYSDGAGTASGFRLVNDVATGGDTQLLLTNDGGVAGLRYAVGASNYEVWHSGNLAASDISAVPTSRTVTAGNGMTGGGALSANITLTMGTPSTISNTSTNSVTSTSHAHALDQTYAGVYEGTSASNTSFPIGTVISARGLYPIRARNSTQGVSLYTGDSGQFILSDAGTGVGTALSGTWAFRGLEWGDGSVAVHKMQRIS